MLLRRAAVVAVSLVTTLPLLLGLTAPTAAAATLETSSEKTFTSLLNHERTSRGLSALRLTVDLMDVARRHSHRMADANSLYHNPKLSTEVTGWLLLAENVGYGGTADKIHAALMASSGHRANILNKDVTQLGMGAVRDGNGRLWVTQVFRKPDATKVGAATYEYPATTCTVGTADCPVDRLAGADRYATAVAISKSSAPTSKTVVVVSGAQQNLADGLVAAPLARRMGAPVLLVAPDSLPTVVSDELKRRGANRALVIGGTGSVSAGVASALTQRGLSVERIAGSDRYDTARLVAQRLRHENGTELPGVVLASGASASLVDALGAGGAASYARRAIVLTHPSKLSPAAAAALAGARSSSKAPVDIVGGTGAVSTAVQNEVTAAGHPVRRLQGSDRYATAVAVARAYAAASGTDKVAVVGSGANLNLVDALTGGALARPVVLTGKDSLPAVSQKLLTDIGIQRGVVLGGTGAVSQTVINVIGDTIR